MNVLTVNLTGEKMLSVEEARQQMLETIPVLLTEKREILQCTGYVLAEALHATENIPPFDNSAMDGFAVRSIDVKGASKEKSCCAFSC